MHTIYCILIAHECLEPLRLIVKKYNSQWLTHVCMQNNTTKRQMINI